VSGRAARVGGAGRPLKRATVFAGFGGQGLLFAGEVLARAALASGRETIWIPSYGPEMRGGTAHCTVIVADGRIGSPVVDELDAVAVLTPPSLASFEPRLAPGGTIVVNRSLIEQDVGRDDVRVIDVPCTAAATHAGAERLTAVVALAALARDGADTLGVDADALMQALRDTVSAKHPELLEANEAAFAAGLGAATAASASGAPVRAPWAARAW